MKKHSVFEFKWFPKDGRSPWRLCQVSIFDSLCEGRIPPRWDSRTWRVDLGLLLGSWGKGTSRIPRKQWPFPVLLLIGSGISLTARFAKQKGIVLKPGYDRGENLWRINVLSSFCLLNRRTSLTNWIKGRCLLGGFEVVLCKQLNLFEYLPFKIRALPAHFLESFPIFVRDRIREGVRAIHLEYSRWQWAHIIDTILNLYLRYVVLIVLLLMLLVSSYCIFTTTKAPNPLLALSLCHPSSTSSSPPSTLPSLHPQWPHFCSQCPRVWFDTQFLLMIKGIPFSVLQALKLSDGDQFSSEKKKNPNNNMVL